MPNGLTFPQLVLGKLLMMMKDPRLKFCPVPQEQQPVNEYEQLKRSWLFSWATLQEGKYWQKLSGLWLSIWIVTGPVAAASFLPQKHPLLFILSAIMGTTFLLSLILLRLYLGWYYIGDRLNSQQIAYEESGWYDGQVWQKTPAEITRDRLLFSYQVKPILKRLEKTAILSASLIGGSGLIWFLLEAI
jgi:hypothetical protein